MAYVQRTTKTSPTDMWLNPYWYDVNLNPFFDSFYCLPNCTIYAWGRLLELGAQNLTLCHGNAGSWYGYNDGYPRGQTPRLGAVGCWHSPTSMGQGHVAIVEEYDNESITISNSDFKYPFECGGDKLDKDNVWNMRAYFAYEYLRYPYSFSDYVFQGFIYVPIAGGVPPEPDNWISDNRYLIRSEMDSNAIKFYYTMTRLGCSYNAIVGMLANIEHESKINPGVWEDFRVRWRGYGLTQWSPYTKYSDWAGADWEDNGQKECERIIYEGNYGISQYDANQWFSNWYAPYVGYPEQPPISLFDYLRETALSPKVLADYWLLYYEHPDESNIPNRIAEHQELVDYYNNLLGGGGYIPPTPPTPTPAGFGKFKLMDMINKRKFVRKRGLQWR